MKLITFSVDQDQPSYKPDKNADLRFNVTAVIRALTKLDNFNCAGNIRISIRLLLASNWWLSSAVLLVGAIASVVCQFFTIVKQANRKRATDT